MSHRPEKVAGRLQEIISSFLNKEAGTQSIITVTRCAINRDLRKVVVFLSVFPENFEAEALSFAQRRRRELRSLIAKELPMKNIPLVEFEIDIGEKNRQEIDQLLDKL